MGACVSLSRSPCALFRFSSYFSYAFLFSKSISLTRQQLPHLIQYTDIIKFFSRRKIFLFMKKNISFHEKKL